MVLKVVRGKIFQTLDLAWLSQVASTLCTTASAGRSFRLRLVGRTSGWPMCEHNGQELRPCQVVKELGYLIDNLCRSIISERGSEIKGKVDGPEDGSRNGKLRAPTQELHSHLLVCISSLSGLIRRTSDQLVQSRQQELEDRRLVRLSVAEDQIDSWRISLQRAARYRRSKKVLYVNR
jgi:hypothetical protein